jgi:hypothetical protein
MPRQAGVRRSLDNARRLQPLVEAHVTPQTVLRYLDALCTVSAPSSAASLCRGPVLQKLWTQDGILDSDDVHFDTDAMGTGNALLSIGASRTAPVWYVAHLDSISYLVQPASQGRHPLVPFCVHLTEDGERPAEVLRYDLETGRMAGCAEGRLLSEGGQPYFIKTRGATPRPGDRIVPVAPFDVSEDGLVTAHVDNAAGVAALALAAVVLARAGVDALLVFPDEEEGPTAVGNQSMSRGMARLASRLNPPELAIVVDSQQAVVTDDGPDMAGRLGSGAVMSEFSSLARGSVTPPPLYAAGRAFMDGLAGEGVRVGESPNRYTSRSDDVSLMLRTNQILLLGYPSTDRHFDRAYPTAHLADIVDLTKALVYASALPSALGGGCHG